MANDLSAVDPRVLEALALYADGTALHKACETVGIGYRTFAKLVRASDVTANMLSDAHESCAAAMVREATEISDRDVDPMRARLRVAQRQWVAERLDRKRWGAKLDIDVSGQVSVSAALAAAEARVRPIRDLSNVIDAQAVDVPHNQTNEPTDSESVSAHSGLPNPFD